MSTKTKETGTELAYKSGNGEIAFKEKDGLIIISSAGFSMSFLHQQATHIGCFLQDAGYSIRRQMGIAD